MNQAATTATNNRVWQMQKTKEKSKKRSKKKF
jgi:hypothetical protein